MQIQRGRIFVQRLYDVADEIDLRAAEALLTDKRRLSFRPKSLRLPHPPIEVSLGSRPNPVEGFPACDVALRVYDLGALSVTYAFDMPPALTPEGLVSFAARTLAPDQAFTDAGRRLADEFVGTIRSACKISRVSAVTEDYVVFRIYETSPKVDSDSLDEHIDIARLLLGETGGISKRERAQLSHSTLSYGPDELVVVDWNAALIYDPSNSNELMDLLEMASMQLLELRAYDDIVGTALARVYDELEHDGGFRSKRYDRLSREIMRMVLEFTEISDRIENSLHTLGDSWLARLHRAAVTEFDIPRWQRLLDQKLEVLRQINALLVDQITSRKSLTLEASIVFLIVFEIVVAALNNL